MDSVSGGLRADDVARFNAFGFLVLRGLFSRKEAEALRAECEALTLAENPGWDRTTVAGVADLCEKGERHGRLLDDDRVHDIPHKLLGHDFLYEGSACSWYDGDTPWHGGSGAVTWAVPHIKVALYLDDLGPDDGCLRVLPGAHRNYLRMIDDRWCDPPDYFLPVRNRNRRLPAVGAGPGGGPARPAADAPGGRAGLHRGPPARRVRLDRVAPAGGAVVSGPAENAATDRIPALALRLGRPHRCAPRPVGVGQRAAPAHGAGEGGRGSGDPLSGPDPVTRASAPGRPPPRGPARRSASTPGWCGCPGSRPRSPRWAGPWR